MTTIAIDFETANERRDSACAVGLAWIEHRRVVRRESRLIRPPELRFAPGNIRVHGILPADVRDRPGFAAVMAEFMPDLAAGTILAHNASFDIGVLRASLHACGQAAPPLAYLCTVQVARRVFPDPAGCGLAKVAGRLGIRFSHHDAGDDAYACAEIALAAMRETETVDIAGLSRAIALPLTRIDGGPPPPPRPPRGPIAERALRTFRPAEPARPRFAVRGSTGNRYEVTLDERAGALSLRCTCMAGRHGMRCRHVKALAVGDVTDLLSDNAADLARVLGLLAAVP
ncbi:MULTISPECIES: 3'-5' exonuclease [Methylobacterium]|jgi:DNA polymerase-3 subunit epsilon|uniref:3'-5' exonuclease DinG n=1 Tax=Methylobacterium hispanicum TaxID=270350 RepID=A0AAV4ZIW4_9HYPH|nr:MULTISPECIES: 3'-5' exonuclease [Methylobacterium]GJD88123.1 3'-5' exonuclease DinG [Methylobacterium hispanicum]